MTPDRHEVMPQDHRLHLFVINMPGDPRYKTYKQHEKAVDQAIAAAEYNTSNKTGQTCYHSESLAHISIHPITRERNVIMLKAHLPIKGLIPKSGLTVDL